MGDGGVSDDLEAQEVHTLEIVLAVLLLTGLAFIQTISFNRVTGRFTLNVGSDLFVWKEIAPAAPATPAAPTPPATADKSKLSAEKSDNNEVTPK